MRPLTKIMLREYLKTFLAIVIILSLCVVCIIERRIDYLLGLGGAVVTYLFGVKQSNKEEDNEKTQ